MKYIGIILVISLLFLNATGCTDNTNNTTNIKANDINNQAVSIGSSTEFGAEDQHWVDFTKTQNDEIYSYLENINESRKNWDSDTLTEIGKKLNDDAYNIMITSNNMTVSSNLTPAKKHYEEAMRSYAMVGYYAEIAGKDNNKTAMHEADNYAEKANEELKIYKLDIDN